MSFKKINNIEFYYELLGAKSNKLSPIVFISGYTCDHNSWRTIAEQLASDRQILIFDNQGIGKTKDHGQPLTAENMAKNTFDLITELGLIHPIVVGYAFGGNIALAIELLFPAKLSQIFLLSSVTKWSQQAIRYVEALYEKKTAPLKDEYLKKLYTGCFSKKYKKQVSLNDFHMLFR